MDKAAESYLLSLGISYLQGLQPKVSNPLESAVIGMVSFYLMGCKANLTAE